MASGSSALLAEAIHSIADIGNQVLAVLYTICITPCTKVLLRTGIMQSRKDPTPEHPYGYTRDKFIGSLISAVGIFCLGAGVTIAHGVSVLFVKHEIENIGLTLGGMCRVHNFCVKDVVCRPVREYIHPRTVLGIPVLLEGISLQVAVKTVAEGAAARGMPFWEYVRRGMDPTSIAVMLEDGGAVAGLLIAGTCTSMVYLTGNTVYDAIGSICVGTLLGAIAIFLVQRNRSLLLGTCVQGLTYGMTDPCCVLAQHSTQGGP